MVARLKKVMLTPKYAHTLLRPGDIPTMVVFREYATCTSGLIRQVPARSVTTNDVMRMWNRALLDVPPALVSRRRRISRITRAATFPRIPAENMTALMRGLVVDSMWSLL